MSTRVYFNTSALNRPFDDMASGRTRLEAEAVGALLDDVEGGALEWVGSEYLDFEVTQDPDRERVRRVQGLLNLVKRRVALSGAVLSRARELEQLGFRGLDALHVAAAEAGRAEILVTTDDRLLRRARRVEGRLLVRVVNPTEAVAWIEGRRSP